MHLCLNSSLSTLLQLKDKMTLDKNGFKGSSPFQPVLPIFVNPFFLNAVNFVNNLMIDPGSCHKRQRRKRQSVTAKREKSQTPKVLTAILTLPNLT